MKKWNEVLSPLRGWDRGVLSSATRTGHSIGALTHGLRVRVRTVAPPGLRLVFFFTQAFRPGLSHTAPPGLGIADVQSTRQTKIEFSHRLVRRGLEMFRGLRALRPDAAIYRALRAVAPVAPICRALRPDAVIDCGLRSLGTAAVLCAVMFVNTSAAQSAQRSQSTTSGGTATQAAGDTQSGNAASSSSSQTGEAPAADQEPKPERGVVEFGVRGVWGDEYGRPDLPFRPSIFTSKYNEYRDIRNGFFIRRGHLILDQFVGTNNYLDIQTDKTIYKDQSYLATFGRWNRLQLQIRYDEIPHVFSNTGRTLFTAAAPGLFTISPLLRSTLQGLGASTSLPSVIQTQVVPGMGFYTPQLMRRAGAIGLHVEDNTPSRTFSPVQGDFAIGTPDDNTPFGYNRKNLELSGTWFFGRKSSWKAGYSDDWMDRSHRDADHSLEQSVFTGLDVNPTKDLNFRLSYLHGDRKPDAYVDENALPDSISGGITEDLAQLRRFDEAPRLRNRASAEANYDVTDKLSLSAFGDTTQDNYNRRGGVNSPGPLNFIPGKTNPFYLYGVVKDLSYDWGFDANYTVVPAANFFAEYSHERYHKRMVSRYRVPGGAAPLPLDCSNTARGCDSPNNDWESLARDFVDIYSAGFDFQFGSRTYLTTYYSLSAAKGNVLSHPIGDPTITTGPNKFLLTGTNAAVDYPETTNRSHEVTAVFKYRLTPNLFPKIEYRYQQFDNKDYQTSAMTPYMGCVSPPAPSPALPGCPTPVLGAPSPFYPYFAVGDTSAARYLFLGVDQPSYRVHYISATLEYHF